MIANMITATDRFQIKKLEEINSRRAEGLKNPVAGKNTELAYYKDLYALYRTLYEGLADQIKELLK